jgi:hypothetical protein
MYVIDSRDVLCRAVTELDRGATDWALTIGRLNRLAKSKMARTRAAASLTV